LFSGEVDLDAFSQANSVVSTDADTSRIDELEQEVNALKTELEDLRTLVESLI
ncbi:DUF480 domain-containing protein, partial [Vibrio aestuarianus subsp. francensis]|nr:DUF480 domain-containing protein [Vibrio aestuarianus subsp. francensis]